jgi:hypothetical protein
VRASDDLHAVPAALASDEEVAEVSKRGRPTQAAADFVLQPVSVGDAEVYGVRADLADVVIGAGVAERGRSLARSDRSAPADDANYLVGDSTGASLCPVPLASAQRLAAVDPALYTALYVARAYAVLLAGSPGVL